MAGVREKGKARRKQQIIQAAKSLLASGGIDALSTRRLAEEAELSVHTLYALVGSKDQILEAVMADNHERVADDLARIDDHEAIEKLFAIVESTYRIISEDSAAQKPIMRMLMTRYYEGNLNPNPWWLMAQEKGWMERAITEAIARGQLDADFPAGLIADMLTKIYMANLRDYLFDQATLDQFRSATRFEFWFCLANIAAAGHRTDFLAHAQAEAKMMGEMGKAAHAEAPPPARDG
ncbi:TetR/AcrR family transcriptional regulator [Flavisphingomonas formosensis]|uniref:TetR/AcrR family transcriptional regulator n=1 Tax=Flavisphingomonas formosensis TaxID=861534 RepID=UPI0012F7BE8A|nr:TetR/AcrR family transcriptional regulator [Sphingomonas formosensis]